MKRNLLFEEYFSCSLERLWRALTDSGELAAWLMQNNFEPEEGRRFHFENLSGSGQRIIECQVLKLSPPQYMSWSWALAGNPLEGNPLEENPLEENPTEVIFELSSTTDKRTRLKLSHLGIADARMAELFQNGWPGKIAKLAEIVGADRGQSSG